MGWLGLPTKKGDKNTYMNKEFQINQHVFYIKEKVKAIVKGYDPKENKILISFFPHDKDKRISKLVFPKYLTNWIPVEERKKKEGSLPKRMKNKKLAIKIKYFADIEKVQKISVGDWIDLRAAETVQLNQGEYKLIPLGVGMKLPEGYEAIVNPRSSTFKTWGILLANSQGVIDSSYSGNDDEWKFPAYATRNITINKNDRICQFRIQKIMDEVIIEEVEELDEVSRGGLGSTGKN